MIFKSNADLLAWGTYTWSSDFIEIANSDGDQTHY